MENLIANSTEAVAVILFGIGFTMLLFHRNLFRYQPVAGVARPYGNCRICVGDRDHAVTHGAPLYALPYFEPG